MKITTLILDVDEVLADFLGPALKLHGKNQENLIAENLWPAGTWSVQEAFGMSQKEFWNPIHEKGVKFWEFLEPLPWMERLLEFCHDWFEEVMLVTAPCRGTDCLIGKERWIKRYFGEEFSSYDITKTKEKYASETSVILDDSDANVRRFIEAGGHGIVFPRHNNSRHLLKDDPCSIVMDDIVTLLNT